MANKILGLFKKPIPYESDGHRIKTHLVRSVKKEDGSFEESEYSSEDLSIESIF